MTAFKILAELRRKGIAIWLDGPDIRLPLDTPTWALQAVRDNRDAVYALLLYEEQVHRARRLHYAIDDEGQTDALPEYESVVDALAATERTLRQYELCGSEFAAIFAQADKDARRENGRNQS